MLTRQHDIWRYKEEAFTINNPLLASMIGIVGSFWLDENGFDYESKEGNLFHVRGFNASKDCGYVILSYFAQKLFNIERLPFCTDRVVNKSIFYGLDNTRPLVKALQLLSNEQIADILRECEALYEHTQLKLREQGLNKVRLVRNISIESENNDWDHRYQDTLFRYIEAAKFLGLAEVQIEMDTLNSFTNSDGEYRYLSDIVLSLDVDARDVFYCSALIDSPHQNNIVESNEWVVVNRACNGLVTIPLESIEIMERNFKRDTKLDETGARAIVERYTPLSLRHGFLKEANYGNFGLKPTLKRRFAKWLYYL
ncbi:hypothetical protein [Vibrio sp. Hal054]|uniref:hypothetical protein n=1 Tax=Vibrio sp. Hal054 TaxID=3035158 RepID=UPI00301D3417